jgi:hypothetical protein
VKDTADQGLAGNALLQGTGTQGAQILTGEANVDVLILGGR